MSDYSLLANKMVACCAIISRQNTINQQNNDFSLKPSLAQNCCSSANKTL